MARNWLRSCSLSLTGNSSRTIKGGGQTDLRIRFCIMASSIQAPNMARFRVYNPSPTTVSAFDPKNAEFKSLSFSAGYEGNTGVVYSGDIKQVIYGHETTVDSFLDIFCADGDKGYNAARVTKTLAAGYTPQDKLQVALDALAPFGITRGNINIDLSTPKYPRGLPMIGMARDIVREVAYSKSATWSIQGEKLNIINGKLPIQTSTFAMNSATGMIGWPKQTQDGIEVTSLLNCNIQPDTLLQIKEADILKAEQNNNSISGPGSTQNFNLDYTGRISSDGIYRVLFMERRGDTRGAEWTDFTTCLGTGATLNQAEIDAGYGGKYQGSS